LIFIAQAQSETWFDDEAMPHRTQVFTPMKITIEKHQNKLRLRWACPETGKRKNLALGVEESGLFVTGESSKPDRIIEGKTFGEDDKWFTPQSVKAHLRKF
jgi:HSP20 family molecular chaperone IbpA